MTEPKNHPIHPDYSIFTTKYQSTWQGLLLFEAISLFGRLFLANKPKPRINKPNLLHLGCGTNYIKGWINADFFRLKFWAKPKPEWQLDLRFPLNCESNFFDGAFTEHTFEHLTPYDIFNLLKELNRCLKKGAVLRICVPGLDQTIEPYLKPDLKNKDAEEMRKLYPNLATAIWGLTQTWGHYSVWNGELLKMFLLEAGFSEAREVNYKIGIDENIILDSENRRIGSLYVEAVK